MGGIAAAIGGAAPVANDIARQRREQNFLHQENSLKQLQEQYNNLADALERQKNIYAAAPDIVERLNDVEMQIRAAHMPGQPVDAQSYNKLVQAYLKAKQEANIAWQTHAANPGSPINQTTPAVRNAIAQATGRGGVPPVAATPTPPPFQNTIAGPPPQQQAAPAAQPATSPVQPAAQGGGNSSPATFPTAPVPPIASPGIAGAEPGPSAADTAVPTLSTSTSGASVAPVVNLDDLLARSQAGYADTGIMSPVLHQALQHQMGTQADLEKLYRSGDINLEASKHKLAALRDLGILTDKLPPAMQTAIGAGAFGINVPGMAQTMQPRLLSTGTMGKSAPPGTIEFGTDQPVKPDVKYRVMLLNGEEIWQPMKDEIVFVPNQEGGVSAVNRNTQQTISPVEGAVTPAMLGTQTSSTVTSPGSAPVTTGTLRQRVVPGKGAAPAPRSGGVPPTGAGRSGGGGTGISAIDERARQVASGNRELPTDARTANAVQDSMVRQGLELPPVYPAPVQEALSKNQTSLDAINQVLGILEPLKTNNKPLHDLKDRLLYAAGMSSPDDTTEAIGKISVTDILAAGRVLSSAGIRSNVFNYNDALTHTPDPWKDSPKLMYGKLTWMKQLIEDQNKNARAYQRKSGVLPPVSGAPATGGKPPTNAQEYLQSIGHQ